MADLKRLPRTLSSVPYIFTSLVPLSNIEKKQQRLLAEKLAKGTNFDHDEVRLLLLMIWYCSPTKINFDRGAFRQMLHGLFKMTDDIIMDRVFRMFDQDNDGLISQKEWVNGMSTFLRSEGDERAKWAFQIYDLNNDGFITREEMFHLLKNSMVKLANEEDRDESIKDIVEMTNKKMDIDRDGRVSESDFVAATGKDRLLTQAFGKCLPREECVRAFRGILEQFREQL
ncbi:calaxin-like [Sycon ciliatum]|uniref:calaxin-like n=1 Tax=Sycon ciliatum TaxID=27933 RepID=UPI0031F6AE48